LSSNLTVKQGIYDPSKRFAVTNIQNDKFGLKNEDFTFYWGKSPITIKSGQTIELPHHLAVKATIELTDKIMYEEVHAEEIEGRKTNKDYRSPKGLSVGIPNARDPIEKKIMRELALDEENPQVQVMRAQIKEELLRDLKAENATGSPALPASSVADFEGVNLPTK
jgi:hypothetical protein